jgi:pimeloyl-ACP methyl ester carboxylesterase
MSAAPESGRSPRWFPAKGFEAGRRVADRCRGTAIGGRDFRCRPGAVWASLLVLASAFQERAMARINNIVLVHGACVDGSSWARLYDILKEEGFTVSVVQNPTISLEGDVAATNLILDMQEGPAVLVGHSYGGVVITEAGRHPKVTALVYVAAFAPDKGESVNTFMAAGDAPPLPPPKAGYVFFQDKAKLAAMFSADVDPKTAAFWADSQVPCGLNAYNGAITEPAWRGKPSWYLVPADDKNILPLAQRRMSKRAGSTVVEVPGSHWIYASNPRAVAALIKQAAESVNSAA